MSDFGQKVLDTTIGARESVGLDDAFLGELTSFVSALKPLPEIPVLDMEDPLNRRMANVLGSPEKLNLAYRLDAIAPLLGRELDGDAGSLVNRYRKHRSLMLCEAGIDEAAAYETGALGGESWPVQKDQRPPSTVDRVQSVAEQVLGEVAGAALFAGYGLYGLVDDPATLNSMLGLEGMLGSERPEGDLLVHALAQKFGQAAASIATGGAASAIAGQDPTEDLAALYQKARAREGAIESTAGMAEEIVRVGAQVGGFVIGTFMSPIGQAIGLPGRIAEKAFTKAPGWMRAGAEIAGTAVGWGGYQALGNYYDPATGELNGAGKRLAIAAEGWAAWLAYGSIAKVAAKGFEGLKKAEMIGAFTKWAERSGVGKASGAPLPWSSAAWGQWVSEGMPGLSKEIVKDIGERAVIVGFEALGFSSLDGEFRKDVINAVLHQDTEARERAVTQLLGTWLGLAALRAGGVESIVPRKRAEAPPFEGGGGRGRGREPGPRGEGPAGERARGEELPDVSRSRPVYDGTVHPTDLVPLQQMGWRGNGKSGVYRMRGDDQRTFRVTENGEVEISDSLAPVIRNSSMPPLEALRHATIRNHIEARRLFAGLDGVEIDTDGGITLKSRDAAQPSQDLVFRFGSVYQRDFNGRGPWRRTELPEVAPGVSPQQEMLFDQIAVQIASMPLDPEVGLTAVKALEAIRDVPREVDPQIDEALQLFESGALAQAGDPGTAIAEWASVVGGYQSGQRAVENLARSGEPAAEAPVAKSKGVTLKPGKAIREELLDKLEIRARDPDMEAVERQESAEIRGAIEKGKPLSAEQLRTLRDLAEEALEIEKESLAALMEDFVPSKKDPKAMVQRNPDAIDASKAAVSDWKKLRTQINKLAKGAPEAPVAKPQEVKDATQEGKQPEVREPQRAQAEEGGVSPEAGRGDRPARGGEKPAQEAKQTARALTERAKKETNGQKKLDLAQAAIAAAHREMGESAPTWIRSSPSRSADPLRREAKKLGVKNLNRDWADIVTDMLDKVVPQAPAEIPSRAELADMPARDLMRVLGDLGVTEVKGQPLSSLEPPSMRVEIERQRKMASGSESGQVSAEMLVKGGAVVGAVAAFGMDTAIPAAFMAGMYGTWAKSTINSVRDNGDPDSRELARMGTLVTREAYEMRGILAPNLSSLLWKVTGMGWDLRSATSPIGLVGILGATAVGQWIGGPFGATAGAVGATYGIAKGESKDTRERARGLQQATRKAETVDWGEERKITLGDGTKMTVQSGVAQGVRVFDDWSKRSPADRKKISDLMADPHFADIAREVFAFEDARLSLFERAGAQIRLRDGSYAPISRSNAVQRMTRKLHWDLLQILQNPGHPFFEAIADVLAGFTGEKRDEVLGEMRKWTDMLTRQDGIETARRFRYLPDRARINGEVIHFFETTPSLWARRAAQSAISRASSISVMGQFTMTGDREGKAVDVRGQATMQLIKSVRNKGANEEQRVTRMIQLLNGAPIDLNDMVTQSFRKTGALTPKHKALRYTARGLYGGISLAKSAALSIAYIVNIPEPFGNLAVVTDTKHVIQAYRALFGAIREGRLNELWDDFRDKGIITEEVPYTAVNSLIDFTGWARAFSEGRLTEELASRAKILSVLTKGANELNDLLAGAAALSKAGEMHRSGGHNMDPVLLQALGFSREEAQTMSKPGGMPEERAVQYARAVVGQTQGSTLMPAEKGPLQNTWWWRTLMVPFDTFAGASIRTLDEVALATADAVKKGDITPMERAQFLGQYAAKKGVSGLAGALLRGVAAYLMLGVSKFFNDLAGDPIGEIEDLMWLIIGGGPGDALRYQMQGADEPSDLFNMFYAVRWGSEIINAMRGEGPYRDLSNNIGPLKIFDPDIAYEFIRRNYPAFKYTETLSNNPALSAAISSSYKWMNARGVKFGGSGPADNTAFSEAMREAQKALGRGDGEGFERMVWKAAGAESPEAAKASLAQRSFLTKLKRYLSGTDYTISDLESHLGDEMWKAIMDEDIAIQEMRKLLR